MATQELPASVKEASGLLLASQALSLFDIPTLFDMIVPATERALGIWFFGVVYGIWSAIYLLLIVKIRKRRNWARWTVLVLTIALLVHWGIGSDDTDYPPLIVMTSIVTSIMDLCATYLLFNRESSKWYSPRPQMGDAPIF